MVHVAVAYGVWGWMLMRGHGSFSLIWHIAGDTEGAQGLGGGGEAPQAALEGELAQSQPAAPFDFDAELEMLEVEQQVRNASLPFSSPLPPWAPCLLIPAQGVCLGLCHGWPAAYFRLSLPGLI